MNETYSTSVLLIIQESKLRSYKKEEQNVNKRFLKKETSFKMNRNLQYTSSLELTPQTYKTVNKRFLKPMTNSSPKNPIYRRKSNPEKPIPTKNKRKKH